MNDKKAILSFKMLAYVYFIPTSISFVTSRSTTVIDFANRFLEPCAHTYHFEISIYRLRREKEKGNVLGFYCHGDTCTKSLGPGSSENVTYQSIAIIVKCLIK